MATLEQRLIALAEAVGADIKVARVARGDLATLQTTAKGSLVAAINEVLAAIGSGSVIDDAAGNGVTDRTWSVDKIFDSIEAAKTAVKNDLTNGASAALDTLSELATALGNDPSFSATIATALTKRVRFDAAQTLTAGEKLQACENIGIGQPDTNFVTAYETAKA
jgi:hypothetical protein